MYLESDQEGQEIRRQSMKVRMMEQKGFLPPQQGPGCRLDPRLLKSDARRLLIHTLLAAGILVVHLVL